MDYKIRKATIEDLEVIKELNKKLCVKESKEFDDTINPDYPTTKVGDEYFRNRITGDDSFAYVAMDNEKVIGYFIGGINDTGDYRIMKKIGEAETAFVEEDYRSKGIGTSFMKMFEDWCRERGIKRLKYNVSSENKRVIKLYKKEGYKEYDIVFEKDI